MAFLSGQTGVDIFLLLSGYGLGKSLSRPWNIFLMRRLISVLPPYYICLFILFFIGIPRGGSIPDLLLHIFCLHGATHYFFGFDNAFWYMGLIIPVYILFTFTLRIGYPFIFIFLLIFIFFIMSLIFHNNETISAHLVMRIPAIILGYLCAIKIHIKNLLSSIIFFVLFYTLLNTRLFRIEITNIGFAIFYMILTYFLCHTNIFCKFFSHLGKISFPLYLVHDPIAIYFSNRFSVTQSNLGSIHVLEFLFITPFVIYCTSNLLYIFNNYIYDTLLRFFLN